MGTAEGEDQVNTRDWGLRKASRAGSRWALFDLIVAQSKKV